MPDRTHQAGYPTTTRLGPCSISLASTAWTPESRAADAALHGGRLAPSELADVLEGCAGWPGRRAARLTYALCDGRAESPLESLSRLRLAAARLPSPQLQAELSDELGRFVARSDFYWDEFGVVGEADGEQKYQSRADVLEERRRQRRLEDLGLIVERWGWADLRRFDEVAAGCAGRSPELTSPGASAAGVCFYFAREFDAIARGIATN